MVCAPIGRETKGDEALLSMRDFEEINKIDDDNYNVYIGLGLCAQKEDNKAALYYFSVGDIEEAKSCIQLH